MARRWTNTLTEADITPEAAFWNRRQIMAGMAGLGLSTLAGGAKAETLEPNSWDDVTSYCNFYEFGTGKGDPAAYAGQMTTEPWSVRIDGMVDRPGAYDFQQILSEMTIEERIYRFRCVEAWSMVVPWNGFRTGGSSEYGGCAGRGEIRGLRNALSPLGNAGHRLSGSGLALPRGPAP